MMHLLQLDAKSVNRHPILSGADSFLNTIIVLSD